MSSGRGRDPSNDPQRFDTQIANGQERTENQPARLERLCGPLEPVENNGHQRDLATECLDSLNGLGRRSTCRGHIIDDRHHRAWLERTLGEVKRRTKVIGRFPGEESCLSLVWAVLDLQINNTCNGVKLSEIDRQKLYRLRHEPPESEAEEKEVVAA